MCVNMGETHPIQAEQMGDEMAQSLCKGTLDGSFGLEPWIVRREVGGWRALKARLGDALHEGVLSGPLMEPGPQ